MISEKRLAESTGHDGERGHEIFEEEIRWALEGQWAFSRQTVAESGEKGHPKQHNQLTVADSITMNGIFRKQSQEW